MKLLVAIGAAVIALSSGTAGYVPEKEALEIPAPEPPEKYADWGNLAMREAAKKHYEIHDYQYVGKRSLDNDRTERTFKFWVKKNGREFALYATVIVQESAHQLISINFKEAKS